MKLKGAMTVLIREIDFLGYKNLGELAADIEKYPLAFPLNNRSISCI